MRQMTKLLALLASLLPGMAAAEPVRIALPVMSLESMPIYVAQDKGFFQKHGADVDVVTSRGGGEAMKTYIAGEVQIIGTGFPEVGLMRAKDVDVVLFFAQTSRVPFGLLGRSDAGIKSVADFKGKIIAVTSPGSLTANLTKYFIQQAGMNPDRDVTLVSVGGGGELLGALKSKRADGAMLFEPFVTIAQKEGFAHVVLDVASHLDAFSSSPLSTSKQFLQQHSNEAKTMFDALAEAQNFIRNDHDGVLALAKKRFANADPEVLKAALEHMYKVYSPNGRFTQGNIERTQQICLDLKIMPKSYPYADVVAPMARE
jgi:NitT/TauT family transport system substrate-binding protein